MRHHLLFLFLCLAMLLSSCAGHINSSTLRERANQLDTALVNAYDKRDLDAFMAVYWHDPLLSVYDSDFFIGWDAVRTSWMPQFKKLADKPVRFVFEDIVNEVSGDLVLGRHSWSIVVHRNDQDEVYKHGIRNNVKAMRDGQLVVISDTWVTLH